MQSNVVSIFDFFKTTDCFSIPVFQRNYEWEETQCLQLFEDINNVIKNNRTHFLGTIVYFKDHSDPNQEKYILIDGQQRVSSLMIFIKSLCLKHKSEQGRFILEDLLFSNTSKLRLKPILSDAPVYNTILFSQDTEAIDSSLTEEEKCSFIYQNYNYFSVRLGDSEYSIDEYIEAIKSLNVVVIELGDENPQVVFESLNSTGKPLSQTDLLRNYILMNLDYATQEEYYNAYWINIERNIKNSSDLDDFFRYFWMLSHRSSKITANFYENYKMTMNITDKSQVAEILEKMMKYSEYYGRIINAVSEDFESFDSKLYELIKVLQAKPLSIVVLFLLDQYESGIITYEKLNHIVDMLITYAFRQKIRGKSISNIIAVEIVTRLVKLNLKSSYVENDIWEFMTKENDFSFPDDYLFQSKCNEYEPDEKFAVYILKKINRTMNPDDGDGKVTAERIMPRVFNTTWSLYLANESNEDSKDARDCINKIGNFALVSKRLKDKPFEEKVKEFKYSNFGITRTIGNYKKWNYNKIRSRTMKLAQLAVKTWPIPDKRFNMLALTHTSEYGFLMPSDACKSLTPYQLKFKNKTVIVKSWKELYSALMKAFYNESPEIFEQIIDNPIGDTVFASKNPEFVPNTEELVDGIYYDNKVKPVEDFFKMGIEIIKVFASNDASYHELFNDIKFFVK